MKIDYYRYFSLTESEDDLGIIEEKMSKDLQYLQNFKKNLDVEMEKYDKMQIVHEEYQQNSKLLDTVQLGLTKLNEKFLEIQKIITILKSKEKSLVLRNKLLASKFNKLKKKKYNLY